VNRLAPSTFALLALALFSGSAFAAEAVRVELDPPHILVGDHVTAVLSVPLAEGAGGDATFPDWSQGWGEAEVLAADPVRIEGEGATRAAVQRLTLTAWKPGKIDLPSVDIRIGDREIARTPAALALEVRSVIAADDSEKKPAPPAPPRAQPVPRAVWYALGCGLAIAALAGVLVFTRRYGRDPLAAPRLAPIAELERALVLLAERAPADAFRGLSHAFRRYLGRAFSFHALESTTTEVQRRLAERGVARELTQRSVATLRLADQVKFARRPATAGEVAQRIAETRALAGEVEVILAPPAVEAGAATAPGPAA
jgi:hypothetical protein